MWKDLNIVLAKVLMMLSKSKDKSSMRSPYADRRILFHFFLKGLSHNPGQSMETPRTWGLIPEPEPQQTQAADAGVQPASQLGSSGQQQSLL